MENKKTKIKIKIELVYIQSLYDQYFIDLAVLENTTVKQAIEQSDVLMRYPDIDLNKNKIGIFSEICDLDAALKQGDRIEIYRPLLADPMTQRFKKVFQMRKHQTKKS